MYREVTDGIQVDVEPIYLKEHSRPESEQFVFSYTIRITNQTDRAAQLLSRHWIITDGSGMIREVEGPGVIGETPVLEPGATFSYSSYCPLPTPTGNMRGTYQMRTEDGQSFAIKIPLFFLRSDLAVIH